MKIKTSVLTRFLKKVALSGKQQVSDVLLKFEDDGLRVLVSSVSNMSRVNGLLKRSAFVEYEPMGNVAVVDFDKLIKIMERFDGEILLSTEGNILSIAKKSRKVEVEVAEESYIKEEKADPILKFTCTANIPLKALKEVFKDIKMNSDAKIVMITRVGRLIITNTGKYKFTTEIDSPGFVQGVTVSAGEPLIDALTNLDGDEITISLQTNYPIHIVEETEESYLSLIVAPYFNSEEEEDK